MILVGMTGDIGSGKSTFADFLAEQTDHSGHWESSSIIIEVANLLRTQPMPLEHPRDIAGINQWLSGLPAAVTTVVHANVALDVATVTADKLIDQKDVFAKLLEYVDNVCGNSVKQTEPITTMNKEQYRSLLQWLGGYLAKKISGDIWYSEIIRRIQAQPELQLATIGGVRFPADAAVITSAGGVVVHIVRPTLTTQDENDVTERERQLIIPDAVVINDGSLTQLRAIAQQLYADLQRVNLQQTYRATEL